MVGLSNGSTVSSVRHHVTTYVRSVTKKVAMGQGFLKVPHVSPVYLSTNVPYSFSFTYCSYREEPLKPARLQQAMVFW